MRVPARLAAVLTALALALTLAGGTASPAAAAKAQKVTIAASATTIAVGSAVTLSGTTSPKAAGTTVHLQRRFAGSTKWTTVKKVRTAADGTYRASVTAADDRDRSYRAYVPARKGHRKAHSTATKKIVVTKTSVKITAGAAARAALNSSAVVSGTVTPYVAGAPRVTVQQRDAGASAWTTVMTLALDAKGGYVFAWTPTRLVTQQFRVRTAAHGGYPAATSPVVTVAVVATSPEAEAGLPDARHSVSLGIEDIVGDDGADPDWASLRSDLDAAHVNTLHLAAGRVEWTAFDWAAHPDVAADAGSDHLARAIAALTPMANGGTRTVDLLIDALVPSMIAKDPSLAGQDANGKRATYMASASAIHDGVVGDRFVELARDLAVRYRPTQITFSELMFDDETFGADDLALYRRMTGASDWPRKAGGSIDVDNALIGAWRSQVLYDLLARVRQALDAVTVQVGHRVMLATDVLVNWSDPAAGRPEEGDDYDLLWGAVDRIVLWAYFGTADGRTSADVGALARGLAASRVPTDRYTISVGLWSGADEKDVLTPAQLADAVRTAMANGVTSVNVTPVTLMADAHWAALAGVWTAWPT